MRKFTSFILILLFLVNLSNKAFADTPAPPYSYTIAIGDGKYIFIMLGDKRYDEEPLISSNGKEYPSSGLYYNDGSIIPVWRVDWYSHKVYISSDGRYLVRMGPWPILENNKKPNLKQLAIAFYQNGELTKEYLISDLIKNPTRLPRTVSHFGWKCNDSFNDKQDQLTIDTCDGQKYTFDIKSGKIITQEELY